MDRQNEQNGSFGSLLRDFRERGYGAAERRGNTRALNQHDFATRIGYSERTVRYWEAGKVRPSASTLNDIVEALTKGLTEVEKAKIERRLRSAWSNWSSGRTDALPVSNVEGALANQSPLVGRMPEMEELRSLRHVSASGHISLVLIAGEPGIGKTRLTRELAEEAEQEGSLVLAGRCQNGPASVPYLPFVEMVEQLAETMHLKQLREILGDDAAELARLDPGLRKRIADLPPPAELPSKQERRYLFNTVRDVLERASRKRALVLIFDDLHLADDATLGLLKFLMERAKELPLLLVGTYRDVEDEMRPSFTHWLSDVVGQRIGTRLVLGGLAEANMAQLLRGMTGQIARQPLVEALQRITGGNPYFAEEVIRCLAEEGRLFDTRGLRQTLVLGEGEVPHSVRLVVQKRAARLCKEARRVLTLASILDSSIEIALLETLGAGEPDNIIGALEEAMAAGLIDPDGADYRFRHDIARQAVLAGLSPAHRQRLHMFAAVGLEDLCAGEIEERAADIARHLLAAGAWADSAKTAYCLLIAGGNALTSGAFEQALGFFESGLGVVARETAQQAQLLYGRGRAFRGLHRWDEAMRDYTLALDIYERLADYEELARLCVRVAHELSFEMRSREALEICRRGLNAVPSRHSPEYALLTGIEGSLRSLQGEHVEGQAMLEQAEQVADEIGDTAAKATLRGVRALFHTSLGQSEIAVPISEEAANLTQAAGDLWHAAAIRAIAYVGGLYAMARWDEAAQALDEAERLAKLAGHFSAMVTCQFWRSGLVSLREGTFGWDTSRIEVPELTKFTYFRTIAFTQMGVDMYRKGFWDDAIWCFGEGMRHAQSEPANGESWAGLLLIRARQGDHAAVDAMLKEWPANLLNGADTRLRLHGEWDRLSCIAEALFVLGRVDEAAQFYAPLASHAQHRALRSFDNRMHRAIVAMTAAAAGQWEAADAHFRSALDLATRLPHRLEEADTRVAWARALLLRKGKHNKTRALQMLHEAASRYEAIGMPRHLAITRSLIEAA